MADQAIEEAGHKPNGRIYPAELAVILDRTQHTLRQWEAQGKLPPGTKPKRDSRGWRYWTPTQVDAITAWLSGKRVQSVQKLNALRSERFIDGEPQLCQICGGRFKDLDRHVRMKHGG